MLNMKEELLTRQKNLEDRIQKLTKDKTMSEGPLSSDFEEQAQELENNEVIDALEAKEYKELEQIKEALQRIEAGNYNICINCEEEINPGRLKAVPYTKLCIKCSE